MKYEIRARFATQVLDGQVDIHITWEVNANDMCEAISKAREYINFAECDERAICRWMHVEEVPGA